MRRSSPVDSKRNGSRRLAARVQADRVKLVELVLPLSEKEENQLSQCEAIIAMGLSTVLEVGNALLNIKAKRLYRSSHGTFEAYCRDHLGIDRTYAWRLTGAAERLNLLPAEGDLLRPVNEFQVRPFLKLAPEAFPAAWKRVTERAGDGKVTAALVQEVIGELKGKQGPPARANGKRRIRQELETTQLGQVLVLLNEAKRSVEKGDKEHALATLERVEGLLFSTQGSV